MSNREDLARKIREMFEKKEYKDLLEEWYDEAYTNGQFSKWLFEQLRDLISKEY